ncbi:MAG: PQQ-binding-like beta-propeller repeat protein [Pirellulaceae bacterium]|nr:PQQ-binding-like beta-propeller repeat protein [Pirellulaceae bacterium]
MAGLVQAADPLDWPTWRGPEMNGISREKGLVDTWSPKGENLLWKKPEYATRSTPIVMNGKLYFVCRHEEETTKEGEKTVCLDAKTGEMIWESVHNLFLSDAPAERVGWSSVIGDPTTGNVFVLGLGCQFQCLAGDTGKVIWEHSMSEEYGMLSTYGGRTNFPVVYEDLVIISGVMTQYGDNAIPAHRFVAFDKRTGAAVWFMSTRLRPEDTTYSTPVFTTFNGQAAMVVGAGDGAVYAFQPRTGKTIWKYEASTRGLNAPPVIHDNVVYLGHGERNKTDTNVLGAVFAFDGRAEGDIGEDKLLWKIPKKTVSRSGAVVLNDRVYFLEDGGQMLIIDRSSGKLIGEKKLGRIIFGSPLVADGKIYVTEATGNFWVLKPTEKGLEEVSRVRLNNEEILSSPIVSHGRIYVGTSKALYCIGKEGAEPSADPIPPMPEETPRDQDSAIAHIQIAPVEAIITPGQAVAYQVRGYNKIGQFIKLVEAELSVDGPGAIESGRFKAAEDAAHKVVKVTAKMGELTSTARARIIPVLPWKFDFNDKQVPPTWIGAAYRHQPKEFEGESMLVKIKTIPKGTRSQSWMGWPRLHDYTVQAEVYAPVDEDRRPDMGLINQRYTLDLMAKDQLQIRSWTPRLELRFAKTIDFPWKAGQWYVIKFRSENGADGVTLRGKVWPRGEAEPEAWSIEATDATPNVQGSPGLFGNASVAEYYIDNVTVTPNQ